MPGQRRASGTLGSVKAAVYSVIMYNRGVVENESKDDEVRQKASNCVVQAALAWSKLLELHEIQQGMQKLEHLADGNGYHA